MPCERHLRVKNILSFPETKTKKKLDNKLNNFIAVPSTNWSEANLSGASLRAVQLHLHFSGIIVMERILL